MSESTRILTNLVSDITVNTPPMTYSDHKERKKKRKEKGEERERRDRERKTKKKEKEKKRKMIIKRDG